MNQKDTTEKMLADYNDVFADVSNVLLFKGNRLIKECDLQNTKDKSQYKADGKIHEQERDLSKIWKQCNIKLAMIGMENQTMLILICRCESLDMMERYIAHNIPKKRMIKRIYIRLLL